MPCLSAAPFLFIVIMGSVVNATHIVIETGETQVWCGEKGNVRRFVRWEAGTIVSPVHGHHTLGCTNDPSEELIFVVDQSNRRRDWIHRKYIASLAGQPGGLDCIARGRSSSGSDSSDPPHLVPDSHHAGDESRPLPEAPARRSEAPPAKRAPAPAPSSDAHPAPPPPKPVQGHEEGLGLVADDLSGHATAGGSAEEFWNNPDQRNSFRGNMALDGLNVWKTRLVRGSHPPDSKESQFLIVGVGPHCVELKQMSTGGHRFRPTRTLSREVFPITDKDYFLKTFSGSYCYQRIKKGVRRKRTWKETDNRVN